MSAVSSSTKVRSWERKLTTYVVASGAALGVADQAQAAPIYSGVQNIAIGASQTVDFNLNGDGDVDYRFINEDLTLGEWQLMLETLGNAAVGTTGVNPEASALVAGVVVPAGLTFGDADELKMARLEGTPGGPWPGITNGYLGLRFDIGGQLHYGWAQLSVGPTAPFAATLHDWAYEDVAGAAITTGDTGVAAAVPEPGTLSLLALGSAGLAAHRLRRRQRQERDGQS